MDRPSYVFIHRTLYREDDARDANARFLRGGDLSDSTGERPPYHFWIEKSGAIKQLVPLAARGAHARGYNYRSIAIACMWPADKEPMPLSMWSSLERITALMCVYVGGVRKRLFGHTELDGTSKDKKKDCPGSHIDMTVLRTMMNDRTSLWMPMHDSRAMDNALENHHGIRINDLSPGVM